MRLSAVLKAEVELHQSTDLHGALGAGIFAIFLALIDLNNKNKQTARCIRSLEPVLYELLIDFGEHDGAPACVCKGFEKRIKKRIFVVFFAIGVEVLQLQSVYEKWEVLLNNVWQTVCY